MGRYILRRIAYSLLIIAGVMILTFLLFRLAAGDPASTVLGKNPAPAELEDMREELGTDIYVLDQLGENTVVFGEKIFHLHFLRAMLRPGAPEPEPREGQPMFWTPTAELDRVPMLPGDVAFARRLADSEKSEKKSFSDNKSS